MTDRELLEMAAKAAGYKMHPHGRCYGSFLVIENEDGSYIWNPLIDDGDALRLAVKLGLTVAIDNDRGMETDAWLYGDTSCEANESHTSSEPYTATRRAIVRAAAEIGKAMP